jgi:hypothetical protein
MRLAGRRGLLGKRTCGGALEPFSATLPELQPQPKSLPDTHRQPEPLTKSVTTGAGQPGGRSRVGGHARQLHGRPSDAGGPAGHAGLAGHGAG